MGDVRKTGTGLLISRLPWGRRRSGSVLVWVIGVVVIGGMLIAVMLPSLCRAREPANRVKCASNLRQIGQAISLYAQSNGGYFPPSLAILPAHEDIGAEVMTCPSSNDEKARGDTTAGIVAELEAAETKAAGHKPCLSYVYVGRGLTTATATEKTIVAYEHLDNHDKDGTNVLFGDARVEWFGKKEWSTMATAAGLVEVSSPPTTRP